MNIWQTARFDSTYKKLHSTSKRSVDGAIRKLSTNPLIGEKKVGDLGEFYVYKFREGKRQWLLAYRYKDIRGIELVDLGSHENFYRDLKRQRKVEARKRRENQASGE